MKRIFCPPKELYQGKCAANDPDGVVMPAFSEMIEQGKVCGLNFPVALNPGVAKAIGTMMKQDYQRAVLLRVPKMDAEPGRYFRPTVFLCDEYQNFATVGANDPNGDERFLTPVASAEVHTDCRDAERQFHSGGTAGERVQDLASGIPHEGVPGYL